MDKSEIAYNAEKSWPTAVVTSGECYAGSLQLRDNKRALMAFKKQIDGLLSGSEIRALRENLRITQSEAARIFGGGPVAFAKYEADDVAQSESMDKLLRLALEVPDARRWLSEQAGLPLREVGVWTRVDGAVSVSRAKQRVHLRVVTDSSFEQSDTYRKAS
ncbi:MULTISPECIES: type II TA system antitoxin MqsA family protein [unclassified Pseudomonas]|uniref:type II TA system antitoxin MqsA family protein n=1 Tax=unclassified Pseudomonas TaxID=196821 RepID=UPI0025800A7F|nr:MULTISPECIES: type II TA system antitoxin MqsA family protein [unclassified Pseudomonas]